VTQERNIEAAASKALALHYPKVKAIKILLPGYPDRLLILGGGRHIWVELKTRKTSEEPLQAAVHRELRARGDTVVICRKTREVLGAVAAEYRKMHLPPT
jgi:hypothetical protein